MAVKSGKVIAIVGPTASGKTALAVKLAQWLDTEVVSADARQFYAEMQIGTARPTYEELEGVPHHFLGQISVTEHYGAGQFAKEAESVLLDIIERKHIAVVVGGSGLYIKALLEGLNELPDVPETLRNTLSEDYQANGLKWLQDKVLLRDSSAINTLDLQNPARLLRALELLMVSGKSLKKLYQPAGKNLFEVLYLGCHHDRHLLYERINERTLQMEKAGLVQEVESLLPHRELNALHTVGYTEIFDYLDGKTTLPEALNLVAQHTRNYAKRQLTWFNNQTAVNWIDVTDWDTVLYKVSAFMEAS